MRIVVQKYGGSSVATIEKLKIVARSIVDAKEAGDEVVAVVSAMGDTTDELLRLMSEVSESPPRRELDMLLTAGERISMSLLSAAIAEMGHRAVSLTGSQCGIMTNDAHSNARIVDVRPFRVQDELEKGNIVIVAGFQGTSYRREVTTLGRGGSDTTAVALAAALGAAHCDIFSDVDGVWTADPRVVPEARRIASLSYEEMQELARQGARVLNAQAVEFARERGIAIHARMTAGGGEGTQIVRVDPVVDGRLRELERFGARGIAGRSDLVMLSHEVPASGENRVDDMLAALDPFTLLHAVTIPGMHRLDALVSVENTPDAPAQLRALQERFGDTLTIVRGLGSVAVVGLGIGERSQALRVLLRAMSARGIPQRMTWCSREAIVTAMAHAHVPEAMNVLHAEFLSEDVGAP